MESFWKSIRKFPPRRAGDRVVPIGGPLLHVTPPLSPMFPVDLLMSKGVYANKIFKKRKKKKKKKVSTPLQPYGSLSVLS